MALEVGSRGDADHDDASRRQQFAERAKEIAVEVVEDGDEVPRTRRRHLRLQVGPNRGEPDPDELGASAAVVRVEQLYPWPFADVAASLDRYANAREIVWLQEEPENMGAWNSVKGNLYEAHGDTHSIRRVSRTESGSPATGSAKIHAQEQDELLNRAFAPS